MNCCVKCFEDQYIIEKINSEGTISECNYCGEEEVQTINIKLLVEDFENLLSIYEPTMHGEHYDYHIQCPTDYGELLGSLIQEDWQIFSDDTNQNALLFDILNYYNGHDDYLDRYELYSKVNNAFTYVSSNDVWNEFANSIKRKNRFFPQNDLSNELKNLLPSKSFNYEAQMPFYRARIGLHPKEKMGTPPADKASSGRVNPRGIPYLYVASNEYTCIAEIRPWIGSKVTVATIAVKESLKIVDLSSKNFLTSPFNSDNLYQAIEAQNLLNQLSYELTRPINPSESDIEYIPTQYLAELIKNLGYDGLKYKSSLGNGFNFVFFYPENFEYITTNNYTVSNVGYGYELD